MILKPALKFGLISGGIQALIMILFTQKMLETESSLGQSELIGYGVMLVALSLIFFGIREHKMKVLGGKISFKEAVKVGGFIALIAALIYTFTWMIITEFNPALHESIANIYIKDIESKGLTDIELQTALSQVEKTMGNYKKPLFKFGITMMEKLPQGLIVSLISSIILRTKNQ
ncbi:MAG: hypothetical protein ACI9IP_002131 [Arcticibacterium sp.]|jgi:hypothetical protein